MSTQFVRMYHPLLAATIDDPVLVALQSVDDHAARGWLLVDPDAEPPVVDTPYYTTAAADSRFAKVADIDDPESLTGERLRAAFAPRTVPVSGHTAAYDPARNIYNLKTAHLRRFRARLAAGETAAECRIAAMGTSIVAGQGVTDKGTQAWPNALRALLAAEGVPAMSGPVLAQLGDSGIDPRWTYTGSWAKFGAAGTDRTVLYYSGGSATATFTSVTAGTVAEVWYSNASVPFTVSIDGGSAVTVTPTGGATIGKYQVTGLANTPHSVVVGGFSGNVYLAAASVRNGSGVSIGALGSGGARLSDTYFGQPYDLRSFILDSWAPHLLTIGFMTNEAATSVSAATYKTNMQALITAAADAGTDVLLIGEIPAAGLDLSAYRAALYELADTNDLPLLDLFDRWGDDVLATADGLMTDSFHGSIAGYRDYARAAKAVLLP